MRAVLRRLGITRTNLKRLLALEPQAPNMLDGYARSLPTAQEALDIFAGEWICKLPPPFDSLKAGTAELFQDSRIFWLDEEVGIAGKSVLDLGPLEGAHPYMFERLGAREIISIEGNRRFYLKCLVTKEILGLRLVSYQCGDFMEFLRQTGRDRFDIVNASGVLYHQKSPAELIQLACRAASAVHLWTHYYDEAAIAQHPENAKHFSGAEQLEHGGFRYTGHVQHYGTNVTVPWYCGGNAETSYWMPRQAILDALRYFGMSTIEVNFELPDHPHGPCFSVVAMRGAARSAATSFPASA